MNLETGDTKTTPEKRVASIISYLAPETIDPPITRLCFYLNIVSLFTNAYKEIRGNKRKFQTAQKTHPLLRRIKVVA